MKGLGAPSDCTQTLRIVSDQACDFISANGLVSHLAKFTRFFGAFFIVFGLAMVFYGKRILSWIFRALVFLLVWSIVFAGTYNMIPQKSATTTILVVLCVVAIALGSVAAYFLDRFR